MKTRKLEIRCPGCGSPDVFYSCTPGCCFNHVCAGCHTTFQTATAAAGGRVPDAQPPDPAPQSDEPAAACARCESIAVYRCAESEALVCTSCGALLTLELSDIAPG